MKQEGLTGADFIGLTQQILCGQPFQKTGCGLFKADRFRQMHQAIFRHVVHFAVSPHRRHAVDHAITGFKQRHTTTNARHDARGFRPEARGESGNRIEPAANVSIDVINADSAIFNLHFMFSRVSRFKIRPL